MGGSARRAGIHARRRTGSPSGEPCPASSPDPRSQSLSSSAGPGVRARRGRRTREVFTGIVEELGEITAVETLGDACRFRLRGPLVTQGAQHGDSIAVNGVCLTVVEHEGAEFTADVMAETLNRSSPGAVTIGARVNPERP